MLLPMIQASKLVSDQALFPFAMNSAGCIASGYTVEDQRDGFADLLNGDCRCRLFFPAVFP